MKKTFIIALSTLFVLSLFSCGSKPEVEDEPKEAPVIEQKAEENTTPAPAPVVEQQEPVVEEVQEEIPVDNSEVLSQLENSRNAAIEAGAEQYAAEQLKQIDALYEALKAEDKDISEAAKELLARYEILTNYIKAKKIKEKIDTEDLADFDRTSYDAGVDALVIVETAYAADKAMGPEITQASETAYSKFNSVIIAAYKKLAKEERVLAVEAKRKADSVKAGVSRKEEYKEATTLFQEGDALYAMQSPEKAYERYNTAKNTYTELFEDVSEKRAAALKAIEEAKKRVAESELFAEQADANTPITEPMEGIEEEDTVLLEEDEYENPDDAVIEIAETLDGEEDEDVAEDEESEEDEFEDDEDSEYDEEEADDESEEAQEE